MTPPDLETFVHRRLKALPRPQAPGTLLPRVLRAIQQQWQRPWYARAWFTWPLAGQAACLAALVAIVGGLATWLPLVDAAGTGSFSALFGNEAQRITSVATQVGSTLNAVDVIRRALIEPVFAYAVTLIVMMCATCAAVGAAVARLGLGQE